MFINISTLLTDSFSSSSSSFSSFFELLLRPNSGGGGIVSVGIGNDKVFKGIFKGIRVVYSESIITYIMSSELVAHFLDAVLLLR